MAQWLKQSTAYTFRAGPFVDRADGYTFSAALSIAQADIQISKNGGALAQTSASPTTTYDSKGHYQCPLTATDTNTLGPLRVMIDKTATSLPVWHDFMVVPANVYESLVKGVEWLETTTLRNDVTIAGSVITVKATDGATTQYTRTGTFTAGADVLTGLD